MGIASVGRRVASALGRGAPPRGRLVAALIIVAGALVALTSLVGLPNQLSTGRFPVRLGATSEPAATANFLRGQQTFDAHLIWESYSERVIQSLEDRGVTVEDTQRQLDRLRQAGNPIQDVSYVGGHPIPNGSMEFYIVTRSGPCVTPDRSGSQVSAPDDARRFVAAMDQTCRGDPVYVPYVFTLDGKGKIDRVE